MTNPEFNTPILDYARENVISHDPKPVLHHPAVRNKAADTTLRKPVITTEDQFRNLCGFAGIMKSPKLRDTFWRIFKNINLPPTPIFKTLISSEGRIFSSPTLIRKAVSDFGQKKWNASNIRQVEEEIDRLRIEHCSNIIYNKKLIYESLMSINANTACGVDMIPFSKIQQYKHWEDLPSTATPKDFEEFKKKPAMYITQYIWNILTKYKGKLPEDWLRSRLILLSKEKSPTATIDRTRPICIQTMPTRATEEYVHRKLSKCRCGILNTGAYQTGFKEKLSCHVNLMRIISFIQGVRKDPGNKTITIAVDISQAYDSVDRSDILEAVKALIDKVLVKNQKVKESGKDYIYEQGRKQEI